MQIHTNLEDFRKARAANSTASAFASIVPTVTEPTGQGVIEMGEAGSSPAALMLVPFGRNSDGDTFKIRVWGWRKVSLGTLWVPTLLLEATCTVSALPGVSGADLTDSDLFCDAITVSVGNENVGYELLAPGTDLIAHILVDAKGCRKVTIDFDIDSGATEMNCLYARL